MPPWLLNLWTTLHSDDALVGMIVGLVVSFVLLTLYSWLVPA